MKIHPGIAAIVTGGASGLARATAEALAAAGARVAVFDLNEEVGRLVAEQIGGTFCKVDITDETAVLAAFEQARAAHGQERILVHCAQVSRGGKTVSFDKASGSYRRYTTDDYIFSANGILISSYRMASLAALGMASLDPVEDGERGVITLTASVAAYEGQVGQIAYGSLKAGVNGLVLPMARDLMDLGIRVNSIVPGLFATPPMLALGERNPAVYASLEKSVPFPKRLGKPAEFASLAVELVRNSYFNGQNIRLDGAVRMSPR